MLQHTEMDNAKKRRVRLERKLTSTYFGGKTVYPIRLCNIATKDILPDIRPQLERTDMKEHRGIIQQHVDEMADLLALSMVFLVTPVMVKR